MTRKPALLLFSAVLIAACSSSQVNMTAPRRVVGTESAVRIDAEISDEIHPGSPVGITYQITNQRSTPIAIADIIPDTSWDDESRTVTVSIGSEVPGQTLLPRLISIAPGETKAFQTAARVARLIPSQSADPRATPSTLLRLKVNFLGDTAPFQELIDIPEKAVADSKRADELFNTWLERNEVVYTNAVPVKVSSVRSTDPSIERPAPTPVRRRRG